MSAELMTKAFEISAKDKRLTPADKLILIRWAWKTIDPATPYEIKFQTVARELGMSRYGVKKCVRRLTECGYLMAVSVKVVAGPAFQAGEKPADKNATRVATELPVKTDEGVATELPVGWQQRYHQSGNRVTPIKKKRIKKGEERICIEDLTKFQIRQIREEKSLIIEGEIINPSSETAQRLRQELLNRERAEK